MISLFKSCALLDSLGPGPAAAAEAQRSCIECCSDPDALRNTQVWDLGPQLQQLADTAEDAQDSQQRVHVKPLQR